MAGIVDALVAKAAADPSFELVIPPRDKRYKVANARRAVREAI